MSVLFLAWIALGLALLAWVIVNPVLETPGPRLIGIIALALLPALVSLGGASQHLQQSKRTEFCLSCHEMEPYGQSLWVDDPTHLQAGHFQNSRIPRETACYTCHTQYTMYGDLSAKVTGLRHLLVHYFGNPPEIGKMALYAPFKNRECLHCHEDARSFLEGAAHQEMIAELRTDEVSCLDCHSGSHEVAGIAERTLWQPEEGGPDDGG